MRRVFSCLCIALLLLGCADGDENRSSSSPSGASSPPGNVQSQSGTIRDVTPEPVPDLTLETLGGRSIRLAQQDGRVLLLNFWATWCAPCRKEIPELKTLHRELHPKGLTVIGIALDREGREVVQPYVKKQKINYPIAVDSEGTAEAELGPIRGLPTTLVVNTKGEITKRVLGIFPVDQMKPTLEEMLSPEPSNTGSS